MCLTWPKKVSTSTLRCTRNFALFRKQVGFGLLSEASQAEADADMAIAFGLGTLRLEGASITISCLVMAGLDRVAIVGLLMPGVAIGQALSSRAGEIIGLFVIGEILGSKDGFADELRVSMLLLFTVKGIVFDIIAQLVFFK